MFYHVSYVDLGERATLTPQIPKNSDIEEEGDIPRICVSTSIYSCLKGILSKQKFKSIHILNNFRKDMEAFEEMEEWINKGAKILSPTVYYTKKKAYEPPNASDFRKNNEYWYINKTIFDRVGYICLNTLIEKNQIRVVDFYHEVDGKILNDVKVNKAFIQNNV